MNFNWGRLTDEDMKIIDTWKSEDITNYITIDDTFSISELLDLFGAKDRRTTLKAMDEEGNIVGVILYEEDIYEFSNPTSLNIQFLIVEPSKVNQGIGTKMVEDIIKGQDRKIDVFKVYVEKDNYACMRMVEKFGFQTNKKRDRYSNYYMYELDTRLKEQDKKRKK